jgi:hypothetical protein
MRVLRWIFLIAIVAVIVVAIAGKAPNHAAIAMCSDRANELASYLTKAANLGIVRVALGDVEVDEGRWKSLEQNQKINIAVAAFCRSADSRGHGSVFLRGVHDGAVKASVINGNYSDG